MERDGKKLPEKYDNYHSLRWVKASHKHECDELWGDIFYDRQFQINESEQEKSIVDEYFRNESFAEVIMASTPLRAIISHTTITVSGILCLLSLIVITIFQSIFSPLSGLSFRFTPIELADGTMNISNPNINSLAFHDKECQVIYASKSIINGKTFTISFDDLLSPTLITITSYAPSASKPVRYSLQVSNDGWQWTEIYNFPWIPLELDFRTTPQRGWVANHTTIDFSPPSAWILDRVAYFFIYLGFLFAFACCQAGRIRLALLVLSLSFAATCPVSLAIAAGDRTACCGYLQAQHAVYAATSLLFAAALWADTLSLEALAILNAAHLALKLATQPPQQSSAQPGLALAALVLGNGLPLAAAAVLLCLREVAWRRALAAAAADRRELECAFSEFSEQSEFSDLECAGSVRDQGNSGKSALECLRATCASLTSGRQRPRQQDPAAEGQNSASGRPVRSLDRLYLQAALLRGPLLRRIEAAAAAAGPGCTVLPTALKPLERAAAKAARAYGGDASWLGDVCRHAVTCETPAAMLRSLGAHGADPQLAVVAGRCALGPAQGGVAATAPAGRRPRARHGSRQ